MNYTPAACPRLSVLHPSPVTWAIAVCWWVVQLRIPENQLSKTIPTMNFLTQGTDCATGSAVDNILKECFKKNQPGSERSKISKGKKMSKNKGWTWPNSWWGGDQAIEVFPSYGKKAVLSSPTSVGHCLRAAPNVRCRASSGDGRSSQQWTRRASRHKNLLKMEHWCCGYLDRPQ